ncbi:MAG: endolytic transglycosylase MltG [Candidatus Limnocylindrales bacterium]
MTWTGRDPQLSEPMPVTNGYRQGSVNGARVRGLERAPRRGPWRGLAFLALLMVVVFVGGVLFAGPRLEDAAFDLARSNPQLMRMPMVPGIVQERLGDRLEQPAGDRAIPVKFTVDAGQNVSEIGGKLQAAGLLLEPLAFSYLAVTQGVDDQIHTGTFNLDPTMTPQQLLDRLLQPPGPETTKVFVPVRSGLRIEQVTALLQTIPKLGFNPEEFYQLAMRPPSWVRQEFPWLRVLPEGRSLEGFLGADSNLAIDSDLSAEGFLRLLLADWEKDIGPPVIEEIEDRGKDFYEVLTLASIIERETNLPRERRLVAGVYENRKQFRGGTAGLLQADPTVSYAVDTDRLAKLRREGKFDKWKEYTFWRAVTKQSRRKVSEGMRSYQTYQNPGLPDGPIDSPTLPSILAAARPDTSDGYHFFVACKGAKSHKFAKTLAQHQRNVDRCGD